MRLLFQLEGAGIGGNENTLKTLSPLLRPQHHLALVCPKGPARRLLRSSFDAIWDPPKRWSEWDALVRKAKPTRVVTIHGDIVALAAACKRLGVPVDWWCGHSIAPEERERWRVAGETLFDRVLFPSQYLWNQLGLPNGALLPGIVDTRRFCDEGKNYRRRLGIPKDAFVFGYCGRLVPLKRHEELLNVLSLLPKKFFALLIGNAHRPNEKKLQQHLNRRIRNEKLNAQCLSVGEKALPRTLSAMDVFVSPSVGEGFGSSVLEALSVGVAVVVARSGGPEEILKQMPRPLYYEPGNLPELAALLNKLADEKKLRLSQGRAGRKLIAQRYQPKRWMENFLSTRDLRS